jgi:hypothetical protein
MYQHITIILGLHQYMSFHVASHIIKDILNKKDWHSHFPIYSYINMSISRHFLPSSSKWVYQLASNPSNIVAWHAFLLFLSWCLYFPSWGGEKGHRDTCVGLPWYMGGN